MIGLRDQALSVSGSQAQGSEIAGRRYGHVIDPRTGLPLERDLLAAVVAPSAELAEVLSKALLILGEGAGITLLESQPGVTGALFDGDGRSLVEPWLERAVLARRHRSLLTAVRTTSARACPAALARTPCRASRSRCAGRG